MHALWSFGLPLLCAAALTVTFYLLPLIDHNVGISHQHIKPRHRSTVTNQNLPYDVTTPWISSDVSIDPSEDDVCAKNFLDKYKKFCLKSLRPNPSNLPVRQRGAAREVGQGSKNKLCPCVPDELIGYDNSTNDPELVLKEVEEFFKTVDPDATGGGRWYPSTCVARHRVAVIVPYRNREEHLQRLLSSLHLVLQRQLLDYTIFVIEQINPVMFNRAVLLNIGFVEAKKTGNFDCYVLHDVDMFPVDDRNFYTCSPTPRHMGRYRDNRVYDYPTYFGGIVAIRPVDFQFVNGLSNEYYGWGAEDDDFYRRVEAKQLKLTEHYPRCVSRYNTPEHWLDAGNEVFQESRRAFHPEQGLNTLKYSVIKRHSKLTYTRISVTLPDPPPDDPPPDDSPTANVGRRRRLWRYLRISRKS